jgi:hypothetical protein
MIYVMSAEMTRIAVVTIAAGKQATYRPIRLVLRRIVGWVEALRNSTFGRVVGFRSSTQPTQFKVFCANTKRIDI